MRRDEKDERGEDEKRVKKGEEGQGEVKWGRGEGGGVFLRGCEGGLGRGRQPSWSLLLAGAQGATGGPVQQD